MSPRSSFDLFVVKRKNGSGGGGEGGDKKQKLWEKFRGFLEL
jgi:hypothetical protein